MTIIYFIYSFIIYFSPDEVQQSISGRHDGPWTCMMAVLLWTCAWVNDEHQYDANNDSNEGRPQVVGDGQDSQTAACFCVHCWQAGHQTRREEVLVSATCPESLVLDGSTGQWQDMTQ